MQTTRLYWKAFLISAFLVHHWITYFLDFNIPSTTLGHLMMNCTLKNPFTPVQNTSSQVTKSQVKSWITDLDTTQQTQTSLKQPITSRRTYQYYIWRPIPCFKGWTFASFRLPTERALVSASAAPHCEEFITELHVFPVFVNHNVTGNVNSDSDFYCPSFDEPWSGFLHSVIWWLGFSLWVWPSWLAGHQKRQESIVTVAFKGPCLNVCPTHREHLSKFCELI